MGVGVGVGVGVVVVVVVVPFVHPVAVACACQTLEDGQFFWRASMRASCAPGSGGFASNLKSFLPKTRFVMLFAVLVL